MIDEQAFLDLSVALAGFEPFDLVATGQVHAYFTLVGDRIGPDTLARLSTTWSAIARELPADQRDAAVTARIMDDPVLGLAAQRIILLWYVGNWYDVLPGGSSVVSADGYVEGLMWKAIRAHPMAAKPQGFAAWTLPPPAAHEGVA